VREIKERLGETERKEREREKGEHVQRETRRENECQKIKK
jgi:hypothetical protein